MRIIAQRVLRAQVTVNGELCARIGQGLLLLVAFTPDDTAQDLDYIAGKVARLRIFNDPDGIMNLSVNQVGGQILSVSQFTLYAKTRKGNRPTYIDSAPADIARPLFDSFNTKLQALCPHPIQTGSFGDDMQVELVNDGPVTIIIDSRGDLTHS